MSQSFANVSLSVVVGGEGVSFFFISEKLLLPSVFFHTLAVCIELL